MNNKIKINLFGESISYQKLILPKDIMEEWSTIAKSQNKQMTELIVDPFFYYKLKNKQFQSINDIPKEIIYGLPITPKNSLEIWYNRFKVHKCISTELKNELVLFPIYATNNSIVKLEKDEIYIIEKEIGTIATFECYTTKKHLKLDDLTFELNTVKEHIILNNIKYLNTTITLKKKDTILTYQNAIKIQ